MLYTSNYARKGSDPGAVAISRKPPQWYKGFTIEKLAPTWDIIMAYKKGAMSQNEYVIEYIKLLESRRVVPSRIAENLAHEDIDYYLLCYESPGDFCHRRVLADWVKNETGFVIPEWKNEKEIHEEQQEQHVEELLGF